LKTFREFLELEEWETLNPEKPIPIVSATTKGMVGDYGSELVNYLGGLGGAALTGALTGNPQLAALGGVAGVALVTLAKNAVHSVWTYRHDSRDKVNDAKTFQEVKSRLSSTLVAQFAMKKGMTIEQLINHCISVSDESEKCLSKEEKIKVREAVIDAADKKTLTYGFAQNFVNEMLKEKIILIQKTIDENPAMKPEEMTKQSGIFDRPSRDRSSR